MPQLSLSRDSSEHVAVLTLHNPPQNRIGVPMTTELLAAVDEITARGARAVVLHAEGPDFSYGGDIVPWEGQDVRELRASFELFLRAFNAVEQLPVPVIAAVHGLCFGGGFELALRADVLFAGESARFGHPEQTLGIVTLLGGIHRVAARAGRARAMEWALTSEPVPAAEMAQPGWSTGWSRTSRCSPRHWRSRAAWRRARPGRTPCTRRCCARGRPVARRRGPGAVRPVDAAVRDRRRPPRPGVGDHRVPGGPAAAGADVRRALSRSRAACSRAACSRAVFS